MRKYTALRRLYKFCAIRGLCVRIPLLNFKRLVRTDVASWFLQRLGDSVFRIRWFIWHSNDLILSFDDSSNISVTIVIDRPEYPSDGCDLQDYFASNPYVLIGPSWGSVFWDPSRSYFDVLHVIHRTILTFDRLLLSNTITWCSNIDMHYAASL